ncbi:HTH-type transcriptional activator CmpR [Paraburkholderia sediminicola]|uniref:HTH-type transcriptional activator CmpR n=1 Tax=Paraburkholderia sediminicola TaxID=458836 RepID=A0A6J5AK75_9BURK|nr:LysR family transcriptional regulator [Paraburkholderia sediminicola]CAB3672101.1 HTH-type transcriptional activator CmpR [Paraburkholderia sediminicola]
MNPTFKQLEAFYWTSKLGSFSAASAHLHTTQSAVSKRVAELESALSVTLFERNQKRPAPTSKGRALLGLAAQALDVMSQIAAEAESEDEFAGRFQLGVTELSALTWLPQFISLARSRFPRLTLEPDVDSGRTLLDRLDDNVLDLVVVPGDGNWHKRYNATQVGTIRNMWMASPLLVPSNRVWKASELVNHTLLMQSPTSSVMRIYEDWLRANGVSTKQAIRTNSLPVLGQLTAAGLGISALPVDYFQKEIADGQLKIIRTRPATPSIDYYAVLREDRSDAVAREIARLIKISCKFQKRLDANANG